MIEIARRSLTAAALFIFTASAAFGASAAADGKKLFSDPKFAGGVKACNDCHPDGKGLEKAGEKKEFRIMGKTQKNLEEAINACIVGANRGKEIDVKSGQMQDIVAYVKSLKTSSPKKSSGGY